MAIEEVALPFQNNRPEEISPVVPTDPPPTGEINSSTSQNFVIAPQEDSIVREPEDATATEQPTTAAPVAEELPEPDFDPDLDPDFPEIDPDTPAEGKLVYEPVVPTVTKEMRKRELESVKLPFPALGGTPALRSLLAKEQKAKTIQDNQIRQVLGNTYDPEDHVEDAFFETLDVSKSTLLHDKQKKWKQDFTEGSLVGIPTDAGVVILARKHFSETYKRLDPAASFTGQVATANTLMGMIGSKWGPLGSGVGTGAGFYLDAQIEAWRGYTNMTDYYRSGEEGVKALGWDMATRGMARFFFGPRNPKAFGLSVRDAVQAQTELGLEGLAIGQTRGFFTTGWYRQAGIISEVIQTKTAVQQRSVLDALNRQIEPITKDSTVSALLEASRNQERILNQVYSRDVIGRPEFDDLAKKGLNIYRRSSRTIRNGLYNTALKAEESSRIIWNFEPAQKLVTDLRKGVRARVLEYIPGEAKPRVRVQDIQRAVEDPKIASLMNDIEIMFPVVGRLQVGDDVILGHQQLQALRSRAFNLKHDESLTPVQQKIAGDIHQKIREVMDQPIVEESNGVFGAAYRKANMYNYHRENNLDKMFVARQLRADTEVNVSNRYFTPGAGKELAVIKDLVTPDTWRGLQNIFVSDLARNPSAKQALSQIARWEQRDPSGFNLMVSPYDADKLTRHLREKAKWEASGIKQVWAREMLESEARLKTIETQTAGEIRDIITKAGGTNSRIARNLRGAVWQQLADDAMYIDKFGEKAINPTVFLDLIAKAETNKKFMEFMRPFDWNRMRQFQKYALILNSTSDVGGQMVMGGLRARATAFAGEALKDPRRVLALADRIIRPIYEYKWIGKLLSRDVTRAELQFASSKLHGILFAGAVGYRNATREQRPITKDEAVKSIETEIDTPTPIAPESSTIIRGGGEGDDTLGGGAGEDTLDLPEGMEEIEPGVFQDQQGRIFDLEVAQ